MAEGKYVSTAYTLGYSGDQHWPSQKIEKNNRKLSQLAHTKTARTSVQCFLSWNTTDFSRSSIAFGILLGFWLPGSVLFSWVTHHSSAFGFPLSIWSCFMIRKIVSRIRQVRRHECCIQQDYRSFRARNDSRHRKLVISNPTAPIQVVSYWVTLRYETGNLWMYPVEDTINIQSLKAIKCSN
jgi:hypothetical protein